MRYIVGALLVIVCLGLTARPAVGLDAATQEHIAQLQAQIRALEEQAEQYRDGIAAQQEKAVTLNREIAILQGQIGQLQARISATGAKINLTQTKIDSTEEQLGVLQHSLDQKRATIGRLILFIDQGNHFELVTSFLKYPNLTAILQQFRDANQLQGQLLSVIDELKDAEEDLEATKSELEEQQSELVDLRDDAARQQSQLDVVRAQKNKVLRDTKGQEALYQKQLTAVERQTAQLFMEMQKLESQVIAGGLFIVHITATSVPPKGTKLFGRPEEHPRLTQSYGMTTYARRGAYGGAPHNGVDYAGGYGTPIIAIGDGILVARGTNKAFGNWVAIQHPNNMVSLYAHMSTFAPLAVGASVTRGARIGYEGNTGNATGSHVHLSLYRDFFTYLNEKNGQLYFNYFEGSLNPAHYM